MKKIASWLGRHCNPSETHGWENAELRKGLIEAQSMGHEIAFHGTSQCSNTIEEINYVKRARMLDFPHFKKEFSRITDRDLTYIGYIHFGYDGFFGKRREFILNAFRPLFKSRFEFWKGMNLKRNVKELANFLNKNEIRSTTLKDLIK